MVTLVDRILFQAMSVNASDIHVEPQQKGLRLRFRQDGVLQQYVEPLPSRLIPAVTSRFKILADLDIAERRQAQEDAFGANTATEWLISVSTPCPVVSEKRSVCACWTVERPNWDWTN